MFSVEGQNIATMRMHPKPHCTAQCVCFPLGAKHSHHTDAPQAPPTHAHSQGGSSTADGDEFLSLTQQLALSSAFGAVQCSFGPCSSVQHVGAGEHADAATAGGAQLPPVQQQRPEMVLLVRFQAGEQLQAFLDCPPVAALLQVGPG